MSDRRKELAQVYQQMEAEGLTFERSVEGVCANMGIPASMTPFVMRLMLDEMRSTLTTYAMGPSHSVSGNVSPQHTADVREVRRAMDATAEGQSLLRRLGMEDNANVVPIPAVLESDKEGFFMTPRYMLRAEDQALDSEIASLRQDIMRYASQFWINIPK